MYARHAVVAVAGSLLCLLVALPAHADQKIKTKSNIKNDRIASTCGQDCEQAGQRWANENGITEAEACHPASPAFTKGCKAYLETRKTPLPAEASRD